MRRRLEEAREPETPFSLRAFGIDDDADFRVFYEVVDQEVEKLKEQKEFGDEDMKKEAEEALKRLGPIRRSAQIAEKIQKAENIEEMFRICDEQIPDENKVEKVEAKEALETLFRFQQNPELFGREFDLDTVPEAYGLRDKVRELLERSQNEKEKMEDIAQRLEEVRRGEKPFTLEAFGVENTRDISLVFEALAHEIEDLQRNLQELSRNNGDREKGKKLEQELIRRGSEWRAVEIAEMIRKAEGFGELFKIYDRIGEGTQHIRDVLEEAFRFRQNPELFSGEFDLDVIPEELGLRKKVQELLEAAGAQTVDE